MRVIFMGSPDFAVTAMKALHAAGHEIVCVYSQPPRPKGRGHEIEKTPVHTAAEKMGLVVHTPASLKDQAEVERFRAYNADVAVVAAYGLILRPAVLQGTKLGCVNIHASLLPRWRGAAPIQRAIEAGDTETGITIMKMDVGLDTGPMLLKESTPITNDDTAQNVHDRLAEIGGRLIVDYLHGHTTISPQTQPEQGVTYAHKLKKEEYTVDWNLSAEMLLRRLNALQGLWMIYRGERLRVHRARVVKGNGAPGTILALPFVVACGRDALAIETIQRAGKNAQPVAEFCRGFDVRVGEQCHAGS